MGEPQAAAVIYGMRESGRMRAVTAFPPAAASASFLQSPLDQSLGDQSLVDQPLEDQPLEDQPLEDQPPRLRYNAATSTLSPRSVLAASLRTQ